MKWVPKTLADGASIAEEACVHGGDLEWASQHFKVPLEDWIDLSTGISPFAYPHVEISPSALTRMPYQQGEFTHAVRDYYGSDCFLATNGSQQAISALPYCLEPLPIILPDIGYQEHARVWGQRGAELIRYPALDADKAEAFIDALIEQKQASHLLVINPNNPSGCQFSSHTLMRWAGKLAEGAAMIIDEAFADCDPAQSALNAGLQDKMIVLRSFGKFFGLPGLRLGFVFANENLRRKMRPHVGIWDINGPAQEIATRALKDRSWQREARISIAEASRENTLLWWECFDELREQGCLHFVRHQKLFASYCLDKSTALDMFQVFARQGILLRLIPIDSDYSIVRIGLLDTGQDHHVKRLLDSIQRSLCHLC